MGDDRKQLNALLMEATEKLEMAAQLIRYLGLDHGKIFTCSVKHWPVYLRYSMNSSKNNQIYSSPAR